MTKVRLKGLGQIVTGNTPSKSDVQQSLTKAQLSKTERGINMKCMSCKMEEMTEATNTYFAQLKGCYATVENVPCYKCPQCGEVYYKASVLEKIDALLDKLENIASKIFIMDYSQAA